MLYLADNQHVTYKKNVYLFARKKQTAPDRSKVQVTPGLRVLSIEHTSSHPSGVCNLEMDPRVLDNFWTLGEGFRCCVNVFFQETAWTRIVI
jgi:hypothetical protein